VRTSVWYEWSSWCTRSRWWSPESMPASRSRCSLASIEPPMQMPHSTLFIGSAPYSCGTTYDASARAVAYSAGRWRSLRCWLWIMSYIALSYRSGILVVSNVSCEKSAALLEKLF